MKTVMIALALACGTFTFAQDGPKKERKHDKVEMTATQRSELRVKELTLQLDLTADQQKEMSKIIGEQEAKRQAAIGEMKANREKGVKPTSEERFAKKSKMLDEQIAFKANVKKVLSADQYQKWEDMQQAKKENFKTEIHKKREKGNEPKE